MSVVVYTDGSCLGNPGPGGWGAILKWEDGETQIWGSSPKSTNNEMELSAAYFACLELLKNDITTATIFTDSHYVMKGITQWILKWRKNGYQTATKKPIKNQELWKLLDNEQLKLKLEWKYVKAHNGHEMNEKVDKLAREAAQDQK